MGAFNGPYPKRHMVLSNSFDYVKRIEGQGGYLSRVQRESLPGQPLTVKKNGKYTGQKKLLKDSQTFGYLLKTCFIVFLFFLLCPFQHLIQSMFYRHLNGST